MVTRRGRLHKLIPAHHHTAEGEMTQGHEGTVDVSPGCRVV